MAAISRQLKIPARTVLPATASGPLTPSPRMTCTTTMPNARLASASIVLPLQEAGKERLGGIGALRRDTADRGTGIDQGNNDRTPRNARKQGLSILPTHTSILPGLSAKNSAAPKNRKEKSSRYICALPFCGSTCSSPTVNAVVAQRGMAKNGPIVR